MSRHEGVSCDLCMENNFTGLRYKCLRCNNFDLCAACFALSHTTPPPSSFRHSSDHPMQCILTKADSNILLGGETLSQQSSYCCPFCGQLGLTASTLACHVNNQHADDYFNTSVLCPICAASPDVDPGHIVDDLAIHLSSIHAHDADGDTDSKQLRRINQSLTRNTNQSAHSTTAASNSGSSGARSFMRGSLLHLIDPAMPLPSVPGGLRDVMDPITEFLSHLNRARRLAFTNQPSSPNPSSNHPSSSNQSSSQPSSNQPSNNHSHLLEAARPSQQQTDQQPSQSADRSQCKDSNDNRNEKFLLVKFLETQQRDTQHGDTQHGDTQHRQPSQSVERSLFRSQFIHELFLSSDTSSSDLPFTSPCHDSSTSFSRLPFSSSASSSLSSSSLLNHPHHRSGLVDDAFSLPLKATHAGDEDEEEEGEGEEEEEEEEEEEDEEDEEEEYENGVFNEATMGQFLLDGMASGDHLATRSSLSYSLAQRGLQVARPPAKHKRRLDAGETQ